MGLGQFSGCLVSMMQVDGKEMDKCVSVCVGNSVCAFVHGFEPYFYIEAPPNFTSEDIPFLIAELQVSCFIDAQDRLIIIL